MSVPDQVSSARLRYILENWFNDRELHQLCAKLGLDDSSLPEADKIGALIARFERRRRLAELIANAKQIHPQAPWRETPSTHPSAPSYRSSSTERLLTLRSPTYAGCALRWLAPVFALLALALIVYTLRTPRHTQAIPTPVPPTGTALPAIAGQQRVINTPTSSPTVPTIPPTSTLRPTATPASRPVLDAPPTATPTATHTPPATATPVPTSTPTHTHTPWPSPTHTLTPWPSPTASTTPPPPSARPAPATPTQNPIPAPELLEPESEASFADRVRFKFTWYRRLNKYEKVSIYVQSRQSPAFSNWWANETDILLGGGSIHELPNGYQFEVNYGLDSIPAGTATWQVAIVEEKEGVKRLVSPWSQERAIYRLPWPGKHLG